MLKTMINYIQREKYDNLHTPEYAVKPLLKYLGKTPWVRIWCPCDTEDSYIVKVLRSSGYKVVCSDITTGQDFFSYEPKGEYDIIVTNPPYSDKDAFIERCYELKKDFALLLPMTAEAGVNRVRMYRQHGIGVIVFDRRVNYTAKNANWFYSVWMCHWEGIDGKIFFETLRKEK